MSDDDRAELPRELFALAARRLEYGAYRADEGGERNVTSERMSELSGHLHDVGQDLMVIAAAIAVIAQGHARG